MTSKVTEETEVIEEEVWEGVSKTEVAEVVSEAITISTKDEVAGISEEGELPLILPHTVEGLVQEALVILVAIDMEDPVTRVGRIEGMEALVTEVGTMERERGMRAIAMGVETTMIRSTRRVTTEAEMKAVQVHRKEITKRTKEEITVLSKEGSDLGLISQ